MFWVRRLLIALGALVLLAGIVLVALVLLVNPNDYKSTLVDLVKERYDRTLVIDGDIRLSIVPRLGLDVGGVSLSEPHSNQVFAAVDSARASVAFWPLFSRHIVIEHLTLTGVKANVMRDADGHFNFDDLLRSTPTRADAALTPGESSGGKGELHLAVGGVTISGGDIALRDAANDTSLRLERLNVSATAAPDGNAFDVGAAARLLGQSPRADATVQMQGRVHVDAASARYAARGMEIRMAGVLPSVRTNGFSLRGDAAYDAAGGTITLTGGALAFQGDIAFATPLTLVEAQLAVPQLLIDLQGDRLQVEGLAGKAQGRMGTAPFTASLDAPQLSLDEQSASGGPVQGAFALEGERGGSVRLSLSDIAGTADALRIGQAELKASLRREGRTLAIDMTSPVSGSLPAQTLALAAARADTRLEGPGMPEGGLRVPVTGRLSADVRAGTAQTRWQAAVPGGEATLTADAQRLWTPVPLISADLVAKHLDLDVLWPPVPASAPSPNGAARAVAPPPSPDSPLVDLSWLQMLDAQWRVRVAELSGRDVRLRGLDALLALSGGKADLDVSAAQAFDGKLDARLTAQAGNHQIATQGQWDGVAVGALLQRLADHDGLTGRGNLRWALTTVGRTEAALRQGLDGEAAVTLRDGAVRGVNIAQTLRDFRTLIGRGEASTETADRERRTDFSELHAELAIDKGMGTLRELQVAAPLLRIAEGSPAAIDLVNERLDLMLDVRVVNTSTGQDGKALDALRGVVVPVQVHGTWAAPEYTVQWNRVAARTLGQTLEREAGRQIERLLGGRRGGDAPAAPSGEPDDTANPAGRLLGDALKGLFNP